MKNIYVFLICLLPVFIFLRCKKDTISSGPDCTYDPTPYNMDYPDAFPLMVFDEDNPLTVEGVELGRKLYYDSLLSPNGTRACASCHFQSLSFTTDPTVLPHLNLGWNSNFLWKGKVSGNVEDIMLFEVEEFFKTDLSKFNNHERIDNVHNDCRCNRQRSN